MKRPGAAFLLYIRERFCVHAVFFPTLPFIGMTVPIPGLSVVIRCAADYGQTRKEKFPTWSGLQWSSSGASSLPKQPSSSVLHPLPFTVCPGSPLLTRTRPDGRCFFPVVPNCPFLLSVSPVALASIPSESSFCSAKVVGLRKCQVTAISLCFIKNNDAGCACPTFLMSKTCRVTYNPNLIEAEKRLRTQMGNESQ